MELFDGGAAWAVGGCFLLYIMYSSNFVGSGKRNNAQCGGAFSLVGGSLHLDGAVSVGSCSFSFMIGFSIKKSTLPEV